jgi:hypothetical protein
MWLPKAKAKGWKEVIDWKKLQERVEAMRGVLEGILLDANDVNEEMTEWNADGDWKVDDNEDKGSPRNKCIFWREFRAELRKSGLGRCVGVGGQFSSFQKWQPG